MSRLDSELDALNRAAQFARRAKAQPRSNGAYDESETPRPPEERPADLRNYMSAGDIDPESLHVTWLVEDLLVGGCFYQVIGSWKTGKSLVTADACCHISVGMDWAGRQTERALVIWVAGESLRPVQRRILAWRLKHNVNAGYMALELRMRPVYLNNITYASDLAAEIAALQKKWGGLPVLVVIDTLAANFQGNENTQEDMNDFVNNLVNLVIKPHHATGIVIHHTGHSDRERGRGSSVLPGAVDGTFRITKTGSHPEIVTIHPQESRDSGESNELHFRIDTYELPVEDSLGRVVFAPVVHPTDETPQREAGTRNRTNPSDKIAYNALHEVLDKHEHVATADCMTHGARQGQYVADFKTWRDLCYARGISESDEPAARRQAFNRARKRLQANGKVQVYERWVWLHNEESVTP